MKFTAIFLLALLAFTSAQFLRKADSNDDVDVTVDVDGINTAVSNIEALQAINESNIVVISKSNFGTIVQQLGEFSANAQQQNASLLRGEDYSQDDVDVDVSLENINTAVSNIEAAQLINESNILVIDDSNFGTIVQQLGEFSASAQTSSRLLQAEYSEDNVETDVEVSDINTAASNIEAAQIINGSNIVVIDNANFGTIVQQLGEFSSSVSQGNKYAPNLKQGSADTVDTNVDINGVNTAVSNIGAAQVINDSNIVVLDNVNFGTIVQQLGEFNVSLEDLVSRAREI